jgi:hypothetical protein
LKRGIIFAIGGLSFLLAGCGPQKPAYTIQVKPKWQGQPYHIAFDSKTTKPSKTGITIPDVTYTANPDMLENRACLVVRFDDSGIKTDQTIMNQMVMGPVDIHGTQGALPADYMEATDEGLAHLLEAYKVKGKVKVSVLLARSSIPSQAGPSDIDENQLSDWLSTDVDFKSPGRAR